MSEGLDQDFKTFQRDLLLLYSSLVALDIIITVAIFLGFGVNYVSVKLASILFLAILVLLPLPYVPICVFGIGRDRGMNALGWALLSVVLPVAGGLWFLYVSRHRRLVHMRWERTEDDDPWSSSVSHLDIDLNLFRTDDVSGYEDERQDTSGRLSAEFDEHAQIRRVLASAVRHNRQLREFESNILIMYVTFFVLTVCISSVFLYFSVEGGVIGAICIFIFLFAFLPLCYVPKRVFELCKDLGMNRYVWTLLTLCVPLLGVLLFIMVPKPHMRLDDQDGLADLGNFRGREGRLRRAAIRDEIRRARKAKYSGKKPNIDQYGQLRE